MCKLNKVGEVLGHLPQVKAMTDVTGFGLLGHLVELCNGSNLQAVIEFDKVPKIDSINEYVEKGCIPGGTGRNWISYGNKIGMITDIQRQILADPQTSGGLLIAVKTDDVENFEDVLRNNEIEENCIIPIGWLEEKNDKVLVKVV